MPVMSFLRRAVTAATLAASIAAPEAAAEPRRYAWTNGHAATIDTLAGRIAPPSGFARRQVPERSFAAWLRGLPMRPVGARVSYFDGRIKPLDVHAAVIDIDVGKRDLQQCADAIMRLRAEWLFGIGRLDDIAFDYTGGGRVSYRRWATGERPSSDGRRWTRSAAPDASYSGFRKYLDGVFAFAGTMSLERELVPVSAGPIQAGDVFINGGFPGHAVLVADVATGESGERRYLLMQSYMPAQDMHVLIDPGSSTRSPWYDLDATKFLVTPEWTFPAGSLRRWKPMS